MSLAGRVRLAWEILRDYPGLLSVLRKNDLSAMAATARAVSASPAHVADPMAEARRLGVIVRRVLAPLPTEKRCLIRSLMLVRLLQRRGISNRLVIGVGGGRAVGHAWVEHEGVAVLPPYGYERLVDL